MLVVLILKGRPSNQLIKNLSKNTQAPSNLKFRLAGSGGDSRTGVPPMNSIVGLARVTDFLHQPFSR